MKYINRDMEKVLRNAKKQFSSVIITGPRQSGKTTLVKHLFARSHKYVSMDNPELRIMAREDPKLFFENYPPPIIIDEIQYTPDLLSYIKIMIDENKTRKGRFILTGSQLFPLMKNVSESLAGRIAVLTLLPFMFAEISGRNIKVNINTIKKWILSGGFPEININKKINYEMWFSGYLQTYLERDVRQLRQIGDLSDFQRFLQLMATINGQIVNMSNISRDLGVAVNTIKAWVSILEASGQVIIIKPFYINKGKRLTKSPKIFFLDTGLLCYLTGINSLNQVLKGPLSGQLFETVVIAEIVKYLYNLGKLPRLYYWRTSYGEEVDFIIEYGDRIIPLEVKMSSQINGRMAKSINSFCELFNTKVKKGFIVNMSQDDLKLGDKVYSVSFSKMLNKIFN